MNKLSPALPIAHVVLRILIVLNWLGGAAILALLAVMPNRQWIMAAFKLSPSPDADQLIMGLRAVAALGLATIPLNYVVLKRLLARRITLTERADRIGMTLANLSILKTGKARAIRCSTLNAICGALSCQPGDILRFQADAEGEPASNNENVK